MKWVLDSFLVLVLCSAVTSRGQDLKFSWEEELPEAGGSATSAVPTVGGSGFSFSWEDGIPEDGVSPEPRSAKQEGQKRPSGRAESAAGQTEDAGQRTAAGVVRAPVAVDAATEELRRKNAELQRRIAELSAGKQSAEGEVQKLNIKLRALAKQVTEATDTVRDLKKRQADAPTDQDMAKQAEVAARLSAAKDEKGRLAAQVAALQKRVIDLRNAERQKPAQPAGPSVQPGSDMYRDLETRHAKLKQALTKLETEKQATEAARAKAIVKEARVRREREEAELLAKTLHERLETALAGSGERAAMVERLTEQMPELEGQLEELKKGVVARDMALTEKQREMETMKQELALREYRLRKAERMAEIMEKARREVAQKNSSEKRDMHYNMAAVYARDGRYREAEREYLRSLKIDPADADVHYNLGILYDDSLKSPRRAALHYRRYLRLRPYAKDRDIVRGWLDKIDMNR